MVKLQFFDIFRIRKNSRYLIIGPPQCGKTTLITNLINTNYSLYKTESTLITDSLKEDRKIIKSIKSDQKEIHFSDSNHNNNIIKDEVILTLVKDNSNLITLDGILNNNNWGYESWMQELICFGSLRKTGSILSFNYLPELPPSIHVNVDYIFISGLFPKWKLKRIYNDFAGIVPSYNDFCKLYDSLNKYEFIMVDNTSFPFEFFRYNSNQNTFCKSIDNFIKEEDILNGKVDIGVNI